MTLFNYKDLTINGFLNESTMIGAEGEDFNPTFVDLYLSGITISNGKIHAFNYSNSQTLYRAAEGDYELVDWAGTHRSLYNYGWISFDKLTHQFIILEPGDNPFAFDEYSYVDAGELSFENQCFVAAGYSATDQNESTKEIIMRDDANKCYLYTMTINFEQDLNTGEVTILPFIEKNAEYSDLLAESSVCVMAPKLMCWYISNGKDVYRIHRAGGEPEKIFTSENGEVTAMMVNNSETELFVATYDVQSINEHKGTVSILDTSKKMGENIVDKFVGACDKAVSMTYTGSW